MLRNLLHDDVADIELAVMIRVLCSDFAHTVLHVGVLFRMEMYDVFMRAT
jgi:hypothetical protein